MPYKVSPADRVFDKFVYWDFSLTKRRATLAEILEAANKEFPGVLLEHLEVHAAAWDNESIQLRKKIRRNG